MYGKIGDRGKSDIPFTGVTLTGITGILTGEGDIDADCAQHSAAAPVAGMKYNYTYTITSVDKSSGRVTGSIYFVSQTQPATGAVDSEGYLIGYQALSGIFSIQREYSGKLLLKKTSANESMTDGNSCYSLNGAKYSVYSDADCKSQLTVLTVKEDGSSDMAELAAGRYYIKESAAPKGYALDEKIYTVDVTSGNTAVRKCKRCSSECFGKYFTGKDRCTDRGKITGRNCFFRRCRIYGQILRGLL